MKFGLFSNSRRPQHASYASGWEADLAEIAAADRLGIEECWISEHEVPPGGMRDFCACGVFFASHSIVRA